MELKLSPLPLIKAQATGNDFLLVDLLSADTRREWEAFAKGRPRPELAKILCDRHRGFGADGLVILESHTQLDFEWDFYNSDGSRAEMCGNATRAVGLYFHTQTSKREVRFQTRTGPVTALVNSADDIRTELAPIADHAWDLSTADGQTKFAYVSTGNPHAVVPVDLLDDRDALRALARKIKREPRFLKDGVNVTFVVKADSDRLESVTFERGVEDFTLACGTGAVAAAYSVLRGEAGRRMEVRVPGGTLFVVWNNGRPSLSGPARLVAEMRPVQGV
jgi:diaminopimelate epimerase